MASSRDIPSLDGLRAISIALVILSHLVHSLALVGQHGVDVFFVISGFLITHLLLKESESTGTVGLKRFYLRRFFRIFPAFYTYLAVIGTLWAIRFVSLDWPTYLCAASYTYNYYRHPVDWVLSHCWSLSLEEQFYLFWPPCVAALGKNKSTWVAASVILLSPVSRAVTYLVAPLYRGMEGVTLHTRLDPIMCGCLIALLYDNDMFNRIVKPLLRPSLAFVCTLCFLIASPLLEARFGAWYLWSVGYSLRALCVSIVLLYVVRNSASVAGRFLNGGLVRHVGLVSYGLYLWQQLFTDPGRFRWPIALVLTVLCAEVSYQFVERPAFRLRDKIQKRMPGAVKPLVASSG
ncbi:MAG: acyltransferase [Candidatus Acidiferrales bacterium]